MIISSATALRPFPRNFMPDFNRGALKQSQLAEELQRATEECESELIELAGSGLKPTCSSVHETCYGVGGFRGAEKARV